MLDQVRDHRPEDAAHRAADEMHQEVERDRSEWGKSLDAEFETGKRELQLAVEMAEAMKRELLGEVEVMKHAVNEMIEASRAPRRRDSECTWPSTPSPGASRHHIVPGMRRASCSESGEARHAGQAQRHHPYSGR